jgi:hypothetical protein
VVCHPKDQEARSWYSSLQDLEIKNGALLVKWLFKLLTEKRIWQTLLRRKYIGSNVLSKVNWKLRDSHFWVGLAKKFFFPYCSFSIKDESEIRFW